MTNINQKGWETIPDASTGSGVLLCEAYSCLMPIHLLGIKIIHA